MLFQENGPLLLPCFVLSGCTDALGIKQVSGTVAALLGWLQEARTASTGFSSICLLLMLTQRPPLLLCILMPCIFSLLVCRCKQGRTKLTVLDSRAVSGY